MNSALMVRMLGMTKPHEWVKIRFAKDGMTGLIRFNWLIESDPRVQLEDQLTRHALEFTAKNREFGGLNRTYKVKGLSEVDTKLLYDICQDVEQIELVAEHGAKDLMVKRVKSRDEAVRRIIDEVLTPDFMKEIGSWGFTINGQFKEQLGLPALEFQICDPDGQMILRATIDGWTGRYGIDGGTNAGRYYDPRLFQDYIREHFEIRLEIMTAA